MGLVNISGNPYINNNKGKKPEIRECKKKIYEIYMCRPPKGTCIINKLEMADTTQMVRDRTWFTPGEMEVMKRTNPPVYEHLNDPKHAYIIGDDNYVLSGMLGEMWVVNGKKIKGDYIFAADGSDITDESLKAKEKNGNIEWVRVRTRPSSTSFARFVPLPKYGKIQNCWGQEFNYNDPRVKVHGNGDFIIYNNSNGQPEPNNCWVVNGAVFKLTYNNNGWSDCLTKDDLSGLVVMDIDKLPKFFTEKKELNPNNSGVKSVVSSYVTHTRTAFMQKFGETNVSPVKPSHDKEGSATILSFMAKKEDEVVEVALKDDRANKVVHLQLRFKNNEVKPVSTVKSLSYQDVGNLQAYDENVAGKITSMFVEMYKELSGANVTQKVEAVLEERMNVVNSYLRGMRQIHLYPAIEHSLALMLNSPDRAKLDSSLVAMRDILKEAVKIGVAEVDDRKDIFDITNSEVSHMSYDEFMFLFARLCNMAFIKCVEKYSDNKKFVNELRGFCIKGIDNEFNWDTDGHIYLFGNKVAGYQVAGLNRKTDSSVTYDMNVRNYGSGIYTTRAVLLQLDFEKSVVDFNARKFKVTGNIVKSLYKMLCSIVKEHFDEYLENPEKFEITSSSLLMQFAQNTSLLFYYADCLESATPQDALSNNSDSLNDIRFDINNTDNDKTTVIVKSTAPGEVNVRCQAGNVSFDKTYKFGIVNSAQYSAMKAYVDICRALKVHPWRFLLKEKISVEACKMQNAFAKKEWNTSKGTVGNLLFTGVKDFKTKGASANYNVVIQDVSGRNLGERLVAVKLNYVKFDIDKGGYLPVDEDYDEDITFPFLQVKMKGEDDKVYEGNPRQFPIEGYGFVLENLASDLTRKYKKYQPDDKSSNAYTMKAQLNENFIRHCLKDMERNHNDFEYSNLELKDFVKEDNSIRFTVIDKKTNRVGHAGLQLIDPTNEGTYMFVGINGVAGSEQSNNAYKIGQVVVNEIKMALAVGKTIDEIEEAEHNLVENVEDILQKVLDRYNEGKYTVFNFSEESKEKFSFAVANNSKKALKITGTYLDANTVKFAHEINPSSTYTQDMRIIADELKSSIKEEITELAFYFVGALDMYS